MRVLSVNSAQSVYQKRNLQIKQQHLQKNELKTHTVPNFRGGTGATVGILSGAAIGAITAAAIIATGGLAAPVAAVGLGGVICGGAGAGTHIGGILGSIIEDKFC